MDEKAVEEAMPTEVASRDTWFDLEKAMIADVEHSSVQTVSASLEIFDDLDIATQSAARDAIDGAKRLNRIR